MRGDLPRAGAWLLLTLLVMSAIPAGAHSRLAETADAAGALSSSPPTTSSKAHETAPVASQATTPYVTRAGEQEAGSYHQLRRLSTVTANNWAEMKDLCEAGGNDVTHVTLSESSFDASSYPGQIDFSGKSCIIWGSGQTFDLGGAGRFAYGHGSGSSLELHGLIIKNGRVDGASGEVSIF